MKFKFVISFLILLQVTPFLEAKSDNEEIFFEEFSNAYNSESDCNWLDIQKTKKIDKRKFYFYLKDKKKDKNFCDYIFLIYNSFSSNDLYDLFFKYQKDCIRFFCKKHLIFSRNYKKFQNYNLYCKINFHASRQEHQVNSYHRFRSYSHWSSMRI